MSLSHILCVSSLTFNTGYPLIDGDEARRAVWLVDVPLAATHRLRSEINDGKPVSSDLLARYELPIVASALKLYLLELPDSLVSSALYEIIKTIYTNPATSDSNSESAASTRVSVLQNTLGQLRLANIATLDALMTHFSRFIDLTSADESYVGGLTSSLASCVLRPKPGSALQFEEKYNIRFTRDLLFHKDAIFGELKRASILTHSASVARAQSTAAPPAATSDGRARAISSDESNRRAHMEERNRAIANRSRASSPAPGAREHTKDGHASNVQVRGHNHRREHSRGPETRFPVHPVVHPANTPGAAAISSPRSSVHSTTRNSLEVPGSPVGNFAGQQSQSTGLQNVTAGATHNSDATASGLKESENQGGERPLAEEGPASEMEKKNSFGRSRFPRKHGQSSASATDGNAKANRDSVESQRASGPSVDMDRDAHDGPTVSKAKPVGVELVDKPMDDD